MAGWVSRPNFHLEPSSYLPRTPTHQTFFSSDTPSLWFSPLFCSGKEKLFKEPYLKTLLEGRSFYLPMDMQVRRETYPVFMQCTSGQLKTTQRMDLWKLRKAIQDGVRIPMRIAHTDAYTAYSTQSFRDLSSNKTSKGVLEAGPGLPLGVRVNNGDMFIYTYYEIHVNLYPVMRDYHVASIVVQPFSIDWSKNSLDVINPSKFQLESPQPAIVAKDVPFINLQVAYSVTWHVVDGAMRVHRTSPFTSSFAGSTLVTIVCAVFLWVWSNRSIRLIHLLLLKGDPDLQQSEASLSHSHLSPIFTLRWLFDYAMHLPKAPQFRDLFVALSGASLYYALLISIGYSGVLLLNFSSHISLEVFGILDITTSLFLASFFMFTLAHFYSSSFGTVGLLFLPLTSFLSMTLVMKISEGYDTLKLISPFPNWLENHILFPMFSVSLISIPFGWSVAQQAMRILDLTDIVEEYEDTPEVEEQVHFDSEELRKHLEIPAIVGTWSIVISLLLSCLPLLYLWLNRTSIFEILYRWSVGTTPFQLKGDGLWLSLFFLVWFFSVIATASTILVLSLPEQMGWHWNLWFFTGGIAGLWTFLWGMWVAVGTPLAIDSSLTEGLYLIHLLLVCIVVSAATWIPSLSVGLFHTYGIRKLALRCEELWIAEEGFDLQDSVLLQF